MLNWLDAVLLGVVSVGSSMYVVLLLFGILPDLDLQSTSIVALVALGMASGAALRIKKP